MKCIIVFDDTGEKSEVIEDIIGEKGFSDVVVKKRRLEEYYYDTVAKIYPAAEWKKVRSTVEYFELLEALEADSETEMRILHLCSNYIISNEKDVLLSLEKLKFINLPYRAMSGNKVAAILFPTVKSYITFGKKIISGKKIRDAAKEIENGFEIDGLVDIGIIGNFIQCVTGNFDSRYFNSLKGNEYTIVKSSTNKKKIKSEYMFYHLIPEDMKFWFVMPFNYQEDGLGASYTMERLHMTDLAIKWVHGSIDKSEFEDLMNKYFFFFKSRHSKSCSKEEYQKLAETLYSNKVIDRISALKGHSEYKKIEKFLNTSEENSIDNLLKKYFSLKDKIEANHNYPSESVIGHGDPCFANTLYNKSTQTLKFIDPKGALTEDELWTNPYYDIAKLSHSVCGRYDFFNNGLFDIRINDKFSYILDIPFDNSLYIDIFREKLEKSGFDYFTVRLYEVSLFLSMLPLHMDNPYKVFGFILNAKNILNEIETYV